MAAMHEQMRHVDAVVHLGALGPVPRSLKDPLRSHEVNATGTLTLLQAARRAEVPHLVYSSSSSVYGSNPALPKGEREWVRPMSPYAVSKLAAEQYVLSHQQSYGMATLAFRLFNVYGPGQSSGHPYAAVVPQFIEAVLDGRPVTIHGSGRQSRDFTYVGTVCSVLLDAIERRVTHPEPVNLAFGTNTTLLEVVAEIEQILGRPVQVERAPERAGDVRHSQAARDVVDALFPNVRVVSLAEGLRAAVDWYAARRASSGPG